MKRVGLIYIGVWLLNVGVVGAIEGWNQFFIGICLILGAAALLAAPKAPLVVKSRTRVVISLVIVITAFVWFDLSVLYDWSWRW